ncbi:PT domain-containing protein [Micromonospora sp. C31]|uniref:PT domain-containing protein n=1 Tax=Micromonospora sp. C31 TaxID=2824876 RepID=UPI001B362E87|nr:PT domain-containing protein [Micromonospora sp. C31]MBQ1074047.1 PT domain-containing protein [Micromonospora sp. C31]
MVIGLVVVLLLCPCLGLAGWAFWQTGEDDDPVAAPTVSAPADPTAQPTSQPTSQPISGPTEEPTDEPTAAPTSARPSPARRDFAKGDCVVNDGTASKAELRKVPCGPDTYEVLLRIPGTADGSRCRTRAPKATANYVHDNSVDLLDYVLCLKKR